MITFDPLIVSSITGAVSGIIQELWPLLAVPFSVVIAFFIIRKVIFMFLLIKR